MIKVLFIFGTRPEAIKLAPVIKELNKDLSNFNVKVCITSQHRSMLDEVLKVFEIKPDYDLNLMKNNQSLSYITSQVLVGIEKVLIIEGPDLLLVQGDTSTAMAASIAAFYLKVKIGHVEAGLRTSNKFSPFPEEINRRMISIIADLHFAPTENAKNNLLKEGVNDNNIFVTGNTIIDALFWITNKNKGNIKFKFNKKSRIILVTAHRRENFGKGLENICQALKRIAQLKDDVEIVYPVHLNPNVNNMVRRILSGIKRIHLIEPLDYESFSQLINQSYLILSDSGGIQEEAPSLGKPVLVLRNTTERPEAIETGTAKLVGTNIDRIVNETQRLLNDKNAYKKMSSIKNPFGDGKSSAKIKNIIAEKL